MDNPRPYIKLDVCDNTPGCPVIEACPLNVFNYDYNIKKLRVNQNPCKGCQLCVSECEYGAVEMVNENQVFDLHLNEQEYGLARARTMASQYGIDPQPINDDEVRLILSLDEIAEDEVVLVYLYAVWQGESYLGYAFLKEMIAEIKQSIPDARIVKIDIDNFHQPFEAVPGYFIYKKSRRDKSYYGIKNPLYFAPTLIADMEN